LWKLKRLHNYLAEKAGKCLEQLPIDRRPTENELTTAFDDVREHTQIVNHTSGSVLTACCQIQMLVA